MEEFRRLGGEVVSNHDTSQHPEGISEEEERNETKGNEPMA
jgi:hypothetical protein